MSETYEKSPQHNSLLVSVIVPTYARPERLRQLLNQLLAQDVDSGSYEIIVADDGSPQPAEAVVRSLTPGTSVRVRCSRTLNGGPASARNHGASLAAGRLLLFVDDDMSVPPDFIRVHQQTHSSFGPAAVNCDFDRQVTSGAEGFRLWCERRMDEWSNAKLDSSWIVADGVFQIPAPALTSANLSISRADFERMGGFDTGYPFGCEDQDFGARLELYGIRPLLTRRSHVSHIETAESFRSFCLRQQMGARDTVRFVRRFRVSELCGEPAIARIGGPIRPGDSLFLTAKKALRQLVAAPLISSAVFKAISVIERVGPRSRILARLYDLVVGAYLQKGWRQGLKLHSATETITLHPSAEPRTCDSPAD